MVNMESARPYRSPMRRQQAEQTRARVIAASEWLFAHGGYAETTIQAIADRAGVSPQTVYAIYGSKAGIVSALLENRVSSVRLDEASFTVVTAEDQLRRCARMARRIYDAIRVVPDISDGLSSELNEVLRKREEIRFAALKGVIDFIGSADQRARYPDPAVALDLLWSLTGPELYRRLVIERGWPPDHYEKELGEMLLRTLLT